MRETFANAIASADKTAALGKAISELPAANRDTLAFLILHLQNVAASPKCKMSVANLAMVFGPTVVGYSSGDQLATLAETQIANGIMEQLLLLPNEYWNSFFSKNFTASKAPIAVLGTPSVVDGLTKKSPHKFLTTPAGKKKFFSHSPLI